VRDAFDAGPPAPRHEPHQRHARPLLVTSDESLVDDVLRLAAAAGVEVAVVPAAGGARTSWATAPLVLVGDDQTTAVSRAALPRRRGVLVLGRLVDDAAIWRRAVDVGAEQVIFLPDGESWVVDRLGDASAAGDGATVLGVLGGRGGAGASILSAALAFAGLRAGLRTVLVDADPLGGGIDLLLGGEDVPGLRWPDLAETRGRVAAAALCDSLPEVEALTVLSWDRGDLLHIAAEAMEAVLAAAVRGVDLVVVDLPRRPDPAAEVALAIATRTFLVVPAEVRAVASAGRVASAVGLLTPDLRVVVRGPAPSDLEPEVVAASVGLPFAGFCRAEPGLPAALDRGLPPGRDKGPLARLADALVGEVRQSRDLAVP
jgi:secretion/DNA translocation related CpaE-like protein